MTDTNSRDVDTILNMIGLISVNTCLTRTVAGEQSLYERPIEAARPRHFGHSEFALNANRILNKCVQDKSLPAPNPEMINWVKQEWPLVEQQVQGIVNPSSTIDKKASPSVIKDGQRYLQLTIKEDQISLVADNGCRNETFRFNGNDLVFAYYFDDNSGPTTYEASSSQDNSAKLKL